MKVFEKKVPWYVAGLAFECLECGRCCAGPEEGYVWVTEKEIASIAKYLQISEAAFRTRHARQIGRRCSLIERSDNKDCVFLANKRCLIYSVRPKQCRTWPFWTRNIETPEDWSLTAQQCPGINRGSLRPFEEIQEKARGTRE
ncbi:MAG TPA: YkgJ family cysteine cluster protein [Phycisphaerae bacterium]|nr:YkgJ family cysteine cluster protein [Phycisphaerae bacterium]